MVGKSFRFSRSLIHIAVWVWSGTDGQVLGGSLDHPQRGPAPAPPVLASGVLGAGAGGHGVLERGSAFRRGGAWVPFIPRLQPLSAGGEGRERRALERRVLGGGEASPRQHASSVTSSRRSRSPGTSAQHSLRLPLVEPSAFCAFTAASARPAPSLCQRLLMESFSAAALVRRNSKEPSAPAAWAKAYSASSFWPGARRP